MILLIDNYDSFTYNLYQLIASIGNNDILVVRNDAIDLKKIEEILPSHIIISPGPGIPDQAGICINAIRSFADSIPILGICLGHQAIARAFGGEVVPAEKIMHGKTSKIFHNREGIFEGTPLPFPAVRYHSLVVERNSLPSELLIEAETQEGTIMAIKHKTYPCYGFQFHPESLMTPVGEILLKNFFKQKGFFS